MPLRRLLFLQSYQMPSIKLSRVFLMSTALHGCSITTISPRCAEGTYVVRASPPPNCCFFFHSADFILPQLPQASEQWQWADSNVVPGQRLLNLAALLRQEQRSCPALDRCRTRHQHPRGARLPPSPLADIRTQSATYLGANHTASLVDLRRPQSQEQRIPSHHNQSKASRHKTILGPTGRLQGWDL